MEWLREQIYNNFITDNRWRYLTNGLKVTLEVTFFAVQPLLSGSPGSRRSGHAGRPEILFSDFRSGSGPLLY